MLYYNKVPWLARVRDMAKSPTSRSVAALHRQQLLHGLPGGWRGPWGRSATSPTPCHGTVLHRQQSLHACFEVLQAHVLQPRQSLGLHHHLVGLLQLLPRLQQQGSLLLLIHLQLPHCALQLSPLSVQAECVVLAGTELGTQREETKKGRTDHKEDGQASVWDGGTWRCAPSARTSSSSTTTVPTLALAHCSTP
jgi:hypothetical protein